MLLSFAWVVSEFNYDFDPTSFNHQAQDAKERKRKRKPYVGSSGLVDEIVSQLTTEGDGCLAPLIRLSGGGQQKVDGCYLS